MKREAKAPVSPAWGEVADCEESCASTIQLVKQLLERLNEQSEQLSLQEERLALQDELIQQLKDEIARLKGEKGRPQIKPSTLEQKSGPRDNAGGNDSDGEAGGGKRPGSAKRQKTTELAIHDTQVLPPPNIPPGSVFKGYQDYVVQGIRLLPFNTKFRLERWLTPEGKHILGQLPEWVVGHFDPELRVYALQLHYQQHVTQPLLLEHLRDFGVDISSGQLNRLLTEGHEGFHGEKVEILRAGLAASRYVGTDDTGARHRGKNGYTTAIGNELFSWFETTTSKSRINFLELLRAGGEDYVLDDEALGYMQALSLPKVQLALLQAEQTFPTELHWEAYLKSIGIINPRHIKIATEGALYASALSHGISKELIILSDDAGQFKIAGLLHALCWVHAERNINKIIAFSDAHRAAQNQVRSEIWHFYQDLKEFKTAPREEKKSQLEARFDQIFTQKTCFITLNLALGRIHQNKPELLLVLQRPEIPLHNNLRESDIRDFVKKRKISASTRSENGRRCRDTFLSLKKTCQKLKISFRDFLRARLWKTAEIPPLPQIIRTTPMAP